MELNKFKNAIKLQQRSLSHVFMDFVNNSNGHTDLVVYTAWQANMDCDLYGAIQENYGELFFDGIAKFAVLVNGTGLVRYDGDPVEEMTGDDAETFKAYDNVWGYKLVDIDLYDGSYTRLFNNIATAVMDCNDSLAENWG